MIGTQCVTIWTVDNILRMWDFMFCLHFYFLPCYYMGNPCFTLCMYFMKYTLSEMAKYTSYYCYYILWISVEKCSTIGCCNCFHWSSPYCRLQRKWRCRGFLYETLDGHDFRFFIQVTWYNSSARVKWVIRTWCISPWKIEYISYLEVFSIMVSRRKFDAEIN